MVCKLS